MVVHCAMPGDGTVPITVQSHVLADTGTVEAAKGSVGGVDWAAASLDVTSVAESPLASVFSANSAPAYGAKRRLLSMLSGRDIYNCSQTSRVNFANPLLRSPLRVVISGSDFDHWTSEMMRNLSRRFADRSK